MGKEGKGREANLLHASILPLRPFFVLCPVLAVVRLALLFFSLSVLSFWLECVLGNCCDCDSDVTFLRFFLLGSM